MYSVRTVVAATTLLITGTATAQTVPPKSFWTSGFNQGITEYSTGTFDQPVDGGVRLSCLPDGSAALSVQIKGVEPSAGARFRIIPATRRGASQSFDFTASANHGVKFARARSDRQLAKLWAALRGGNNVTIRYLDGSFSVQSLIGASATLPRKPCG